MNDKHLTDADVHTFFADHRRLAKAALAASVDTPLAEEIEKHVTIAWTFNHDSDAHWRRIAVYVLNDPCAPRAIHAIAQKVYRTAARFHLPADSEAALTRAIAELEELTHPKRRPS